MRLLAQVGAGIFLRGLACSSGPRTSARDRTTCSTDTRWRHRQRVPNSRGSMPPVLRPTARPGRCRHRTRTPCRALVQHCEQVIHKSTITMGAADEWNAKAPSGRGEAAADAGAQPLSAACGWRPCLRTAPASATLRILQGQLPPRAWRQAATALPCRLLRQPRQNRVGSRARQFHAQVDLHVAHLRQSECARRAGSRLEHDRDGLARGTRRGWQR